jgi:hypothetical protein
MAVDFANTGRPMLFFTYDLETYADEIRGFYLDFVNTVPGPLVRTNDELADALVNLDAVQAQYAEHAEPAMPTCAAVSSRPLPCSLKRPPMAPTMVTARPSRIQTVPSPITTIQCHLDHGNRSMRAGMSVSMVRSVTPSPATLATMTSP